MKTLALIFATGALCLVTARAESIPEKAADAADTAAQTTKNVGRATVRHTKEAVNTVKDALTPEPGASQVQVTVSEYRIDMSTSLRRGRTAFIVHNTGRRKHNFEVVGRDTDRKFLLDVAPGGTKVLHVDLRHGSYTAYCPVDGHRGRGMEVHFGVR